MYGISPQSRQVAHEFYTKFAPGSSQPKAKGAVSETALGQARPPARVAERAKLGAGQPVTQYRWSEVRHRKPPPPFTRLPALASGSTVHLACLSGLAASQDISPATVGLGPPRPSLQCDSNFSYFLWKVLICRSVRNVTYVSKKREKRRKRCVDKRVQKQN